jgi:hypothetical protein
MNATPTGSPLARLGAGCALSLALFAAIAAGSYRLLTPAVRDPEVRTGFALASALFLSVGLSSFWSLARGHGRGESSRSAVLRRARTSEPPPDGGVVVATGTVRAVGRALTAPLSGVPCVAYTYRMYRVWRSSDGDPNQVPVYWGYASRPFALDAPTGRYRVMAVPNIVTKPAMQAGVEVLDRARRLVQTTSFENVAGALGAVGTAIATAREIFSDDDGEARRDWHKAGEDADPSDLILEEALLPVGAEVSVHGTWSGDRGAVVASGDPSVAFGVSAALGPPENLGSVLPHSTAAYVATAAISTALGAAILWFGLEMARKLL